MAHTPIHCGIKRDGNAEFIVQAVNAYDDLKAKVALFNELIERLQKNKAVLLWHSIHFGNPGGARDEADATSVLLAQAETLEER